jgi:hypothetical protein
MPDTAVGFLILGVGMLLVLGIVFAISSRSGPATPRPTPPPGVHIPSPSFLPVVLSVAAALIGSGLAFRSEDQLANPFLAIPGLAVLVLGSIWWVRAANHEWHETEHGAHAGHDASSESHDDGAAH